MQLFLTFVFSIGFIALLWRQDAPRYNKYVGTGMIIFLCLSLWYIIYASPKVFDFALKTMAMLPLFKNTSIDADTFLDLFFPLVSDFIGGCLFASIKCFTDNKCKDVFKFMLVFLVVYLFFKTILYQMDMMHLPHDNTEVLFFKMCVNVFGSFATGSIFWLIQSGIENLVKRYID